MAGCITNFIWRWMKNCDFIGDPWTYSCQTSKESHLFQICSPSTTRQSHFQQAHVKLFSSLSFFGWPFLPPWVKPKWRDSRSKIRGISTLWHSLKAVRCRVLSPTNTWFEITHHLQLPKNSGHQVIQLYTSSISIYLGLHQHILINVNLH